MIKESSIILPIIYPSNYPSNLPIVRKRSEIIRAIRCYPVVIITGDTGSGKTTQIPKMCLEAGRGQKGRIGCTQPRRVAATSVSLRVAEELGVEAGRLVGYQIRFQDKTSPSTRIKFMTDGILLAETQRDPMLRQYDTLIIDEAHERSLNIDFLLGILRQLLPRRPDLKVIVTSATIDTEKFSQSFNNAPIIEVSGRLYPVEVWYRPLNHALEDAGDITYIDQAVSAVEELKRKRCRGDILIFMPSERDIRETQQRLEGRQFIRTIILPLFGRLSSADQNSIFQPRIEQKIIIATNIAETSITIPGIKYVIDTGLARISQYNSRTHTQSLPIQYISQSSADQRKGRCGRVEAGICIRLYAEEEYLSWPKFTLPEIKRSNLAKVILQMVFLRLGNVSDFPFIDPPSPAAIKDGYAELRELGALDSQNKLTQIGRLMAQLPIDPRIARMLIEAKKEGTIREMAIIASALSIQDPRERPADQEAKANEMHARFNQPQSDFLTLLKLWDTYHDTLEKFKTQNQMRKFCKTHFLSYLRMREWQDIHEQIISILDELGQYHQNEEPASYEAIHRSILSGLLSHIAQRLDRPVKEKNIYQAARGREVMIFPGSGLFGKAGEWIMAAELIRTSRLFARIVANIKPEWLEGLAGDLCKSSYSDPHWEKNRGQVVALERVALYGLVIVQDRKVNYGPLSPKKAHEIFIRSALVEGEIREKFLFLEHNQKVIARIEEWEDKTRRRDMLVDDEIIYQFYDNHIPEDISDIRTFQKWLKDRGGDDFLKMRQEDLWRSSPDEQTIEQFPDTLSLDNLSLSLTYKFEPGSMEDGVNLHIPASLLPQIPLEPLEWLVPGLLQDKITTLLKGLPKNYRKQLIPIQQTAQRLLERLIPYQGSLYGAMEKAIRREYGLTIPHSVWFEQELPDYLRMRFVVIDTKNRIIGQGRDLAALVKTIPKEIENNQWRETCQKWERDHITTWDFENLPEKIVLNPNQTDRVMMAYPGLLADDSPLPDQEGVSLRLFQTQKEASQAGKKGLLLLYALQCKNELKELKRILSSSPNYKRLYQSLVNQSGNQLKSYDMTKFTDMIFDMVLRGLFSVRDGRIPGRDEFFKQVAQVKAHLVEQGFQIIKNIQDVLKEREETLLFIANYIRLAKENSFLISLFRNLKAEVIELLPPDFITYYQIERLAHIPRYLKAVRIRVERAYASPLKDQAKAQTLSIHQSRLSEASKKLKNNPSVQELEQIDEYRWMIEEFKISLFAQEVGTAYPVSAKRLDKKWTEIQNMAL